MAWLSVMRHELEHDFAIVVGAGARGSTADIQGRSPLVLAPGTAREQASPNANVESAPELLNTARPETSVQCHPVTRQMSKVKYQTPNTDHSAASYAS